MAIGLKTTRAFVTSIMPTVDEDDRTYYELLGLTPEASVDQIKEAYREIARIYHPDSNFYSDIIADEIPDDGSDLFKFVTAAYNVLINGERRKEYDDSLLSARGGAPGWEETTGEEGAQTTGRRSSKTEISEEWQKERDYFEENYFDILKPGPKVNLTGGDNEPSSDVPPDTSAFETWDDDTVEQGGVFGSLADTGFNDPARLPPVARRPSASWQWAWLQDPFTLVVYVGIPILLTVVITEFFVYFT